MKAILFRILALTETAFEKDILSCREILQFIITVISYFISLNATLILTSGDVLNVRD